MHTDSILVYVYAVLVGLGGVFGYVRARSLPSLVMGAASAVLLFAAGYGLGAGQVWGFDLAIVLTAFLMFFFGMRYAKSSPKAFMPGGLMAILSLLTLAGLIALPRGH